MQPGRNRLVFALISALLAWPVCAEVARVQDVESAPVPGAEGGDGAQDSIADAVRALEQAALQADFASDAREIALLQRAHDDLSAAASRLKGAQRERTVQLLQDLDQAMERTTAQLGTLVGPGGESFGPRVPSRRLLARLATQAQELQRQAPEMGRLPNTIIVGTSRRQDHVAEPQTPRPSPIDLINREPLSWPLDFDSAWP